MCWAAAGIGVGSFLASGTQQLGFGVLGQRLTRRMRVLLFKAVLRQVTPTQPGSLSWHSSLQAPNPTRSAAFGPCCQLRLLCCSSSSCE